MLILSLSLLFWGHLVHTFLSLVFRFCFQLASVFFGLDIGHCNNSEFFMNLLDVIFDYNCSTGVAFRRLK